MASRDGYPPSSLHMPSEPRYSTKLDEGVVTALADTGSLHWAKESLGVVRAAPAEKKPVDV
ncbi:hypothetical protein M2275_004651 [Rhodococcus opacus]|jgi:hypothetical protein|nr:hypothetical protein [Rhodococcus opacus]